MMGEASRKAKKAPDARWTMSTVTSASDVALIFADVDRLIGPGDI
jgi:hypothetical protein